MREAVLSVWLSFIKLVKAFTNTRSRVNCKKTLEILMPRDRIPVTNPN